MIPRWGALRAFPTRPFGLSFFILGSRGQKGFDCGGDEKGCWLVGGSVEMMTGGVIFDDPKEGDLASFSHKALRAFFFYFLKPNSSKLDSALGNKKRPPVGGLVGKACGGGGIRTPGTR